MSFLPPSVSSSSRGSSYEESTLLFARHEAGDLQDLVVDQIAPDKDRESDELECDCQSIDQLPLVVRSVHPRSHCDDDPHDPNDNRTSHVTDRAGQRVDVLGYSHACHVEGGDREDSQNAEEEEQPVGASSREIGEGVFDERHTCRIHDAGIGSEGARNKARDYHENELDCQAEHALISDHFKRLDVIFRHEFFLEDELEAVSEERGDQQDVADDLQALHERNSTVSPPESLEELKMRLEAPTISTPMSAKMLPKIWLRCAFILRKMMEKMKVVTMAPPRIIW